MLYTNKNYSKLVTEKTMFVLDSLTETTCETVTESKISKNDYFFFLNGYLALIRNIINM